MDHSVATTNTSSRIAGVFLLLAGVSLPIIIVDYVMVMSGLSGANGIPTMTERATFAAGVFDHLQMGWRAEVIAMTLLGAGCVSLLDRRSRSGWGLCLMGCVVTLPMYAVMVGGYGAVLSQPEPDVELFEALNGIAMFSFLSGQTLVHLGLGLAFVIEGREGELLLPRWFFIAGATANIVTGTVFALNHTGVLDSFMVAGPLGLLSHLLVAVLGFKFVLSGPSLTVS